MASYPLDTSRRQFLRGDYRGRKVVVRPPWAAPPNRFLSLCDRCGHCRDACRERIILLTDSGYPRIDFLNGACTFCGDCARICPTGALRYSDTGTAPWTLKAHTGDRCLSFQGVVCRSCGEWCETGAIRFRFIKGGVAQPQVDSSVCSGCGACFAVCPVQAIALRDDTVYQEACA